MTMWDVTNTSPQILLRLPSSMKEDLDLYGRADEFDLPTALTQQAVRRRMHPLG